MFNIRSSHQPYLQRKLPCIIREKKRNHGTATLPYFHPGLFCQLLGRTWLLGFGEAIQDPRPVPEPKHQGTESVPHDLLQIPGLV